MIIEAFSATVNTGWHENAGDGTSRPCGTLSAAVVVLSYRNFRIRESPLAERQKVTSTIIKKW